MCKDMHAKVVMLILLQNALKVMRPYDKNKYSIYFSDAKSLDILPSLPTGEIWKSKAYGLVSELKGRYRHLGNSSMWLRVSNPRRYET